MKNGKILSFSSYRTGTGRTTLVANIAWILASSGKRVLAVDWNLNAPRLAECFYPFFPVNVDLRKEPGMIDILWEFILEVYRPDGKAGEDFDLSTAVLEKVRAINWQFPSNGSLSVLNAGYFDTYLLRAELFPYSDLFENLRGHLFVEKLRNVLKETYDFVLIDGPLSLDDTSVLCSVAVPDSLAICFTPFSNEPEIAAQILKRSIQNHTQLLYDRLKLIVAPVIMRADNSETRLYASAMQIVKETIDSINLPGYVFTSNLVVPYVPFYSYSPALAYFAEKLDGKLNIVYHEILRSLTMDDITPIPPSQQQVDDVMQKYSVPCKALLNWRWQGFSSKVLQPSPTKRTHFFVSYKREDFKRIAHVIAQIQILGFDLWWDHGLHGGLLWKDHLTQRIEKSRALILFVTEKSAESVYVKEELMIATGFGKQILPIKIDTPVANSDFQELLDTVHYIDDPGTVPSRELEYALRELCKE